MESFLSAPLINCFKIYWSTFQKPGESADINIIANTDDIVKLVPIFSGFRDGDKKVHITTEYELEPENASMETSILIFKREITTISNFDKKIAQQFIEKNMLIISK